MAGVLIGENRFDARICPKSTLAFNLFWESPCPLNTIDRDTLTSRPVCAAVACRRGQALATSVVKPTQYNININLLPSGFHHPLFKRLLLSQK
jgi:hypothetical protein